MLQCLRRIDRPSLLRPTRPLFRPLPSPAAMHKPSPLLASRCFSGKPDFQREIEGKYFDYAKLERSIYAWWEKEGYFKPAESTPKNAKKKPFVLPMPPPNVTGYLHMGHAIFVALQDIMARFHRMRGEPTLWLPGTDHAGIATQLLVEKQLLAEGTSRTALGRDAFLQRVWQWKEEKGGYITQQMRRLGASADWTREKFTLEDDMNVAVTEAFVRLYEKGLVYRGTYMVNWSPSLQTAVSDLEVDYVEEEGRLFFFKYELADEEASAASGERVFIPVATTRPETILGDTAVCVHPEDERYKHLIGRRVRVPMTDRTVPVIADEYVDREFGTGALKITPAHDVNDYKLGQKHALPLINVMNKDATINAEGGDKYAGMDRFVCREALWRDMESAGLTIKVEKHMQRVPRSQRGGEVVEPMVSAQWFIRMEGMAQRACEVVRKKELQIVPDRFEKMWFHWLENIHDWCVSRQLWWGHRIPVYYVKQSEANGKSGEAPFVVARSMEDALRQARALYGEGVELVQDEDVLDTWFSSGLWPFATVGWPQKENELQSDLSRFFPASVLETGYDILFFWVARMVTLSLALTEKTPFETIYLHGLVRDAQGEKMSKTKGNVIDPLQTVDSFGADALRFSLVTGSTPGQDVPLSLEKVETNRNFMNKLWNVGKFVNHAISTFSPSSTSLSHSLAVNGLLTKEDILSLPVPERFIVSKAHTLVREVSADLEKLRFGESGRRIYDFLYDDLADWFVEVSKTHLKPEDNTNTGTQQQQEEQRLRTLRVLVYVWDLCLRVLHPYMPFVTETLWQALPHNGESLMCAPWPTELSESELFVDEEALQEFSRFQSLIRAVRNARAEHGVEATKRVSAIVQSSSSSFLSLLRDERKAMALLARIDDKDLELVSQQEKTDVKTTYASRGPFVHLVVEDDLEVFLPQSGLLDKEKERARLSKQAEKLQKDIAGLQARMANKSFVDKAPQHLVLEVKQRLQDMEQQLEVVNATLRSLQ